MEQVGIARFPKPVHGRIPIFEDAAQTAQGLKQLSAWKRARVVKANVRDIKLWTMPGIDYE